MKYSIAQEMENDNGDRCIALGLTTDALVAMLRGRGGLVIHVLGDDQPPLCLVGADNEAELAEQVSLSMENHKEHLASMCVPKEMLNG